MKFIFHKQRYSYLYVDISLYLTVIAGSSHNAQCVFVTLGDGVWT